MGNLANLWRGNFSLPVTYWLWGALGIVIAYLPILFIVLTTGFNASDSVSPVVVYFFICGSYHFLVPVGIWRAAGRYAGSAVWITVARFLAVISLAVQYAWIQTFLDFGSGYAAIYVGILIIVGLLLEYTAAGDSGEFDYTLENPAGAINVPPRPTASDVVPVPVPEPAPAPAPEPQGPLVTGAWPPTAQWPVNKRVAAEQPVAQADVIKDQMAGLWKTRTPEQRRALAAELEASLARDTERPMAPLPSAPTGTSPAGTPQPDPAAEALFDFLKEPPPVKRKNVSTDEHAAQADRPSWAKAFKQAYGDKGDAGTIPDEVK